MQDVSQTHAESSEQDSKSAEASTLYLHAQYGRGLLSASPLSCSQHWGLQSSYFLFWIISFLQCCLSSIFILSFQVRFFELLNEFDTDYMLLVLVGSPQVLILTVNPCTTRGCSWWPTSVLSWYPCIATGDIIHTVSQECIPYSHYLNTQWYCLTWPTTSLPTMTSTTSILVLALGWPHIKIAWATS